MYVDLLLLLHAAWEFLAAELQESCDFGVMTLVMVNPSSFLAN